MASTMSVDPLKVEFPMVNTFIQYPALREPSLEQFLTERGIKSCPASRMVSLEEDPREVIADENVMVNASTQWPATRGPSLEESPKAALTQWPATRGPSLEEDPKDTLVQWPATRGPSMEEDPKDAFMLWPATRGPSLEDGPKETFIPWPATRGPSLEEFVGTASYTGLPDLRRQVTEYCLQEEPMEVNSYHMFQNLAALGAPSVVPMEQNASLAMPVQWPATQCPSLDEFMHAKSQTMVQDPAACDISTTASIDEDGAVKTPPELSDSEAEKNHAPVLPLSLTIGLGIMSAGSFAHETGNCKPCAFLYKDARGCQNGQNCQFCHLCPVGEVKRRKKEKIAMRKMMRGSWGFQNQNQNQMMMMGHGMW